MKIRIPETPTAESVLGCKLMEEPVIFKSTEAWTPTPFLSRGSEREWGEAEHWCQGAQGRSGHWAIQVTFRCVCPLGVPLAGAEWNGGLIPLVTVIHGSRLYHLSTDFAWATFLTLNFIGVYLTMKISGFSCLLPIFKEILILTVRAAFCIKHAKVRTPLHCSLDQPEQCGKSFPRWISLSRPNKTWPPASQEAFSRTWPVSMQLRCSPMVCELWKSRKMAPGTWEAKHLSENVFISWVLEWINHCGKNKHRYRKICFTYF